MVRVWRGDGEVWVGLGYDTLIDLLCLDYIALFKWHFSSFQFHLLDCEYYRSRVH